jgi:hypothetical protein
MVTWGGRSENTVSRLPPPGERTREGTAERTSPVKLAGVIELPEPIWQSGESNFDGLGGKRILGLAKSVRLGYEYLLKIRSVLWLYISPHPPVYLPLYYCPLGSL